MIVVSDTSPLNYLVLIEVEHLLPKLFGDVFVPPTVVAELSRPETPKIVRQWISNCPPWLHIQSPATLLTGLELDPGETEAISLSVELRADSLLMDDRKGRQAATNLGLTIVGTLTLLEQAAALGLISLPEKIAELLSYLTRHPASFARTRSSTSQEERLTLSRIGLYEIAFFLRSRQWNGPPSLPLCE